MAKYKEIEPTYDIVYPGVAESWATECLRFQHVVGVTCTITPTAPVIEMTGKAKTGRRNTFGELCILDLGKGKPPDSQTVLLHIYDYAEQHIKLHGPSVRQEINAMFEKAKIKPKQYSPSLSKLCEYGFLKRRLDLEAKRRSGEEWR